MTTVTIRERLAWRASLKPRLVQLAARAGVIAHKARTWRLTLALPGLAGACLVSAGAGLRFGLWLGLIVAGAFALRIDGRI
jgi:hypothetical protein